MEFSDIMTEPTLQEKLRANKARSISQADATAKREKQQKIQQQQKLQKQKEENDVAYQKHQKDLAEYNKQKQQYDAAVQQLEAEKQAEADKAAADEVARAKVQKQYDDTASSYNKKIQDLTTYRIQHSGRARRQYYYQNGKKYSRRVNSYGNVPMNQSQIRNINGRIKSLKNQRDVELSKYSFRLKYPNPDSSVLSSSLVREYNRHGTNSRFPSLAAAYETELNKRTSQVQRSREVSIQNAKSNAVKAREQHEKTIREYEQKRESAPIPIPSVIDKPLIKATKTRPKVRPSSYFKSVEKTPVSIFGTTIQQSKKVEKTYDTTQTQQKELFVSITKATNYKQAISLREKAMDENLYVGTANTLLYKGEKIDSSGVLIEKKLHVQEDVFEELAKPISPKQEIQTDVTIHQNSKPEIETKFSFSQNSQIPTYEFPDQIIQLGNTPKHYESWNTMSSLLDMEPKTPSKTDKLLNQYIQNNQKQIHNTKGTGEVTTIKIPVLDAVRDYGVEFGLGLASLYATARGKLYNEPEIITQQKIQKIYDSTPHEKSLEAVLFDSAISQSKNTPAMINPSSVTPNVIPKKQSQSVPTISSYIAQKTKMLEGTEYLTGTIGISVLGAFVPFGRGKSAIGQATKPILKTTPSSPNNLAYLLKTSAQEPKIITKKVTVADGGAFDVIDFDAMKKAKTNPYKPTTHDKIKKKSKKFKKGISSKVDQTIGKQVRKLEFENTMYQHELDKSIPKTTKPKGVTSKKPSKRNNPISKASRKLKFENDMYNHNLEKSVTKTPKTPMLDNLLGKPSRYMKTSVTINNKKLKDKSSQIKDTFSDTINDNVVDPISKRTTKPIGKFVKKVKVSKQINEFNLEKLLQDSAPKKYDPVGSMKSTGTSQDMFNGMTKKHKPKKLTKQQKAESGWEYAKANKESDISKSSTTSKSGSLTEQILETKPPKVKSLSKIKPSKKKQSDITIVEQVLHPNRPKMTTTPMLNNLLGQSTGQRNVLKHDVTPKVQQTTNTVLENLLKQNPKLGELTGTKSRKKQKAMLYDLLVQQGKQGTKGKQDYGFVFVHPPKLTTKQTPKTTPRIRTSTKKLPISIKIPQIGLKQKKLYTKEKKKICCKIFNLECRC